MTFEQFEKRLKIIKHDYNELCKVTLREIAKIDNIIDFLSSVLSNHNDRLDKLEDKAE